VRRFIVSDEKDSALTQLKRKHCFTNHNLVTDGVFKECQCIMPVLIYLIMNYKNKVLKLFYDSYQYMVLVFRKKSLRFSAFTNEDLKEIDRNEKIYQKIR
jgi:chemotaxis protein methyltransferase CheR